MRYQIDPASRQPIYRQLVDQIRAAIATGQLAPEDRLPSVRELSEQVVVNPNTVARVFTELEREGLIYMRRGLGAFVARARSELTRKARRERLVELLDHVLTEAVHLGFTAEETLALVHERADRFQWTGRDGG